MSSVRFGYHHAQIGGARYFIPEASPVHVAASSSRDLSLLHVTLLALLNAVSRILAVPELGETWYLVQRRSESSARLPMSNDTESVARKLLGVCTFALLVRWYSLVNHGRLLGYPSQCMYTLSPVVRIS